MESPSSTYRWLLVQVLFTFTVADFSRSFNEFLVKTYGQEFADRMARRDLGGGGSFGGGQHQAGARTSQQPVVLVHGITNTAARFAAQRQYLLNNGWTKADVYATTYGDGGKTAAPLVDMKCDYIKQVRWFIQAVAEFTRRRVDVIGYSMGSPVARKAILGGTCVDTGERLGPPLSALIDTFVAVAGRYLTFTQDDIVSSARFLQFTISCANHGSFLCILPFPGACNMINGLSCNSRFLQDINSRQRYEGLHIFSIYSSQDDKVGYRNACGQLASSIAGADEEFQRGGNHDEVMLNTIGLQASLIRSHKSVRRRRSDILHGLY